MSLTLEAVPPSLIRVPSHGFGDTQWQCFKMETVARSIVRIAQRVGEWTNFTWDRYRELCAYTPNDIEHDVLDWLVKDGSLVKEGNAYRPTNKFIEVLSSFITTGT